MTFFYDINKKLNALFESTQVEECNCDNEQIDELSKQTLGSYLRKAIDDKSHFGWMNGQEMNDKWDDLDDYAQERRLRRYDKENYRDDGINRALKQLTKEGFDDDEGISASDLADILCHRIMNRYPDLLKDHGPRAVVDACESVAEFHAGAHELGSSDIGAMLRQVKQELEGYGDTIDEASFTSNGFPYYASKGKNFQYEKNKEKSGKVLYKSPRGNKLGSVYDVFYDNQPIGNIEEYTVDIPLSKVGGYPGGNKQGANWKINLDDNQYRNPNDRTERPHNGFRGKLEALQALADMHLSNGPDNDQIDEISDFTKRSYRDKAGQSMRAASQRGDRPTIAKRLKGVRKSLRSPEQPINELSKETLKSYADKRGDQYFTKKTPVGFKELDNLGRGLSKYKEKVKSEKQLDELSPSTLGSYIKKAAHQMGYHGLEGGRHAERRDRAGEREHSLRREKRQHGIDQALIKLTGGPVDESKNRSRK